MDTIWDVNKLQLFLVFFIPGFISMKVYDLLVPGERRDFSKALVEAIGYSAINFALLSWLIIIIHANNFFALHKAWYFIGLVTILFVFPIAWPFIFLKLSEWKPVAKFIVHPVQKPWDWVFRKKESRWVIVHFTNGKRIGGRYDHKSFASSEPAEEQIYLEEVWQLDSNSRFIKPIERSKGVVVLGKEISMIEFFE